MYIHGIFCNNKLILRCYCYIKEYLYRDPVWTNDEGICCRNVNNELHFFENNDFGKCLKIHNELKKKALNFEPINIAFFK